MENSIVVGILIIVVFISIRSTVKHFAGRSGCCGGGGYRPKKKKLSNVIYHKTFRVEGMHCDHCKTRVEEVVNDIKGVAGKVDLKKGELTISYEEDVDDELIKSRIERAGYTVTSIR
ncbi:MAG: heavy-metal-associated domain-containing protein [Roseburia sp.]|nr:heavy-metal-associated domain-containing protein [Roseburia sp.]